MEIEFFRVMLGADPEFFFKQEGRVIGSEKVIPKEGFRAKGRDYNNEEVEYGAPIIVIDGVQAEFNPEASDCRETFSNGLRTCFMRLDETIRGKKVEVDFGAAVNVDEEELGSLSEENQQFGCSPSFNTYGQADMTIKDASTYLHRSAGGHIHLGTHYANPQGEILRSPERVVPILDIVLGNTCVLLDRDLGNVERRKNYGRAGEYRTPQHGLEYRTLSNFWLRSYPLASFVLGLARFAVHVAADEAASKKLLSLVSLEDIENAINKNDFELAQRNFNKIRAFVCSLSVRGNSGYMYPLQGNNLLAFDSLVEKGIAYYFPKDAMQNWLSPAWSDRGWERFAQSIIK